MQRRTYHVPAAALACRGARLARPAATSVICFPPAGIATNIITYLTRQLGQSNSSAAASVNAWSGTCEPVPGRAPCLPLSRSS